jgi:hypothetical protein
VEWHGAVFLLPLDEDLKDLIEDGKNSRYGSKQFEKQLGESRKRTKSADRARNKAALRARGK